MTLDTEIKADERRDKLLVLLACDPLIDVNRIEMNSDLLSPLDVKLLVVMACEVPEESLAWFRKNLMPPAQLRRQVAAREFELQEHMFKVSKRLEQMGYELDTRVERGRHTGEIIVKVAEDAKVDLIVVNRRAQSTWQRLLIGSVGDYLARHATRPLLTIPPSS